MGKWQRCLLTGVGLVTAFITPTIGHAQETYTLTGRARDAVTGEPISGVQVAVRGTRFGTLTDATGAYTIAAMMNAGPAVVEATMVGREQQTREVVLGAERRVRVPDFMLRETALELGALIVTGTAAPTARRAIGTAIATVTAAEITETTGTTIDQALQGKVAGAFITSNTGTPGGGVSIRLRGTSSIIGGAEPLYIIDGVIVDNNADQQLNVGYRSNPSNRLADIDPADIENIEILKGAAAAALYGSRANNGVVQIFTKRGRAGGTRVSASSRISRSDNERRLPFALTPVNEKGEPVTRFDHQDLLWRKGWSNDQHVALSGGTGPTRYFLSGNWTDQEGIMLGDGHEKLNVRLNLDQGIGDWLELQAGVNVVNSDTKLVLNGEQGTGGLLTAITFAPTTIDLAARDPESGRLLNRAGVLPNPLEVLEDWRMGQAVDRFIGSLSGKASFSDVRLDYRFGYDTYDMETEQFIPRGGTVSPLGSSSSTNRRSMLINNDLIGTYDWGLSDVRLGTSLGMNHTYTRAQNYNLSASDLSPFTELVRGAVMNASESQTETVTLGFFGQQQASFDDRLFLTGALRADASSTFGADERWQMYPKVSGSWVLSEESFLQNRFGWLGEMRVRAALGYAGNQPPLDFAYARFPRYGSTINVSRLGLVPLGTAGNVNLKPERQREYEFGADISVLDNRIALAATYYDQYTTDLLLARPYAPSTGFAQIIDNVGELSNRGIELELNTINMNRGNFGWTSRLIYSRNENKLEKLAEGIAPFSVGYTNWVEPGYAIGVHRMPAFRRNDDGTIVTDSIGPLLSEAPKGREIVGNPWPDFQMSFTNRLRVGNNWTASFLLDGVFGQELWNQTARIMDIFRAGPAYDRQLRGEITNAQRVRRFQIWESYLEDASYVKLRDVTIAYDTDASWVQRFGLRNMQFELQGRNLKTWTDYSGLDPEVNMFGLSTVARGTDFAVYPNPRTVALGVRFNY